MTGVKMSQRILIDVSRRIQATLALFTLFKI